MAHTIGRFRAARPDPMEFRLRLNHSHITLPDFQPNASLRSRDALLPALPAFAQPGRPQ
ncbi:hypothetical protein [Burkholderia sp. JKS000303]|uniref:hypothetical protein n=1 Tax=Burkholderia sp. JKS000303 TaxID=1938747 RepID=UPI000C013E86|nr:hypothetical protein [Burkholderia sp. JKS000303]PFH19536.1 hypothetical protein BX604_6141 [Burkholderia sp. JKS000303]